MSSFNINGPSNRPIIQGAQNLGQDGGGGGNTGYMNMRNKKKEKKKEENEESAIILEDEHEDTFTKSSESRNENKENLLKTLAEFVYKKEPEKKEEDIFTKQTKEAFNPDNDINDNIFSKEIDDNFYNDIDI